mmetsp:Transcript_3948/g.4448  ORF Transcript_3948/g.4448 Transcript_3948/m.4448 type:complete len:288 (+) Transcript_3948:167-1030(+)
MSHALSHLYQTAWPPASNLSRSSKLYMKGLRSTTTSLCSKHNSGNDCKLQQFATCNQRLPQQSAVRFGSTGASTCHSARSSAQRTNLPCQPCSDPTSTAVPLLLSTTAICLLTASPALADLANVTSTIADVAQASSSLTENSAAVPDLSTPVEVTWEIWFGFFAGVSPFAVATWEFGKRILIQRQCELCKGSGLIVRGKKGRKYKCTACGGFLPWESWERFLESEPGNGGVLRQPKGQTSVLYSVESARRASQDMAKDSNQEMQEASVEDNAPDGAKEANQDSAPKQ